MRKVQDPGTGAPLPEPADPPEKLPDIANWRQRAVVITSRVFAVGALLPLAIAVPGFWRHEQPLAAIALACVYLFWVLVAVRPKSTASYTHLVLIAGVCTVVWVVLATRGVSAAYSISFVTAVMLAVLFSSARVVIATWVGLLAGTAVITVLVKSGLITYQKFGPETDLATWQQRVTIIAVLAAALGTAAWLLLRELEQSLERARLLVAQLQKSSKERDAEILAREQIEQQLWQAQRLDAVGRVAAGFAHDANNNLTVLRGTMDLLRSGADITRLLDDVDFAIDSASAATRQMLSLGRRDVYKPETVSAVQELQQVTQVLRRALPHSITIGTEITLDAGVMITVDRQQFRQALLNLVVNARDAIEGQGNIILRASLIPTPATIEQSGATATTQAQSCLLVEVQDDGAGIDPAVLPRVFEPFYTTKPEADGSGLGLSHVEAFMRRADGQVHIEPGPDQGTCVSLRFPVVSQATLAIPQADTVASSMAPLAGVRVLAVDDDHSVLAMLKLLFDQLGAHVTVADTAAQALHQAATASEPFHLLCTDALMPVTGGAELAMAFAEQYPQVAILVCSGYVEAPSLRISLEDLQYAFLRKPFTSAQLASASLSALQNAR